MARRAAHESASSSAARLFDVHADDKVAVAKIEGHAKTDQERDRWLEDGEEARIREILAGAAVPRAFQIDEALIDAVDLHPGRGRTQDGHNAGAHVSVHAEVGRTHLQPVAAHQVHQLVGRLKALASAERAIAQPSLLLSTTNGTPRSDG